MKFPTSLDDVPTRQEIVLFAMVVLLGLIAFVRAVYLIELSEGRELEAQLKTLHLEKEAIQKFKEAVQSKRLKAKESQKRFPNVRLQILMEKRIPTIRNLTALIGHITSDSFLHGIQLQSVQYDPLQKIGRLGYTSIEMKGVGRYNDIVEYLARLERLETLLNLESFSLAGGSGKEEGGDLSFEWKADYYEMGEVSQGA